LTLKNVPLVVVNHVYKSQGLYPVDIVSGGTGVYLSSSTVWIVTRSKEKEGTDLAGYNFTIKVEKSRYVKEGSKFPITVKFEGGIEKYSGLLDIALASGVVVSESKGFYQKTDPNTGEVLEQKYRRKATMNDAFWTDILASKRFNQWLESEYMIGSDGKKLFKDTTNQIDDSSLDDDEGETE
jgi:hypothetical protein